MGLTIESSETTALATELAHLRQVSVAQAIEDAVRAELAREKQKNRKPGELAAELLAIADRCVADLKPGPSSTEMVAELYDDELGLPR